jgi:hypothetical protein
MSILLPSQKVIDKPAGTSIAMYRGGGLDVGQGYVRSY